MPRRVFAALTIALLLAVCRQPALADAPPPGFTQIREGYRSPAGLVYRGLRPISNLLARQNDVRGRRVFGVFREAPLTVVDEAWRRARMNGTGVTRRMEGSREVIEVDMGRPIGFLGGDLGAHLGRPQVSHVRLIVDGDHLIDAYPDRPISQRPVRSWQAPTTQSSAVPRQRVVRPPPPEHVVRALQPRGVRDHQTQHVLLGLPSQAGAQPNDFLLTRDRYVLSYNKDRKVMNWASWHLDAEDLGNAGRSKKFHADMDLPEDWRAYDSDYSGSGWTRGHMVASGETLSSRELNHTTYAMSNIVPQAVNVNSGPWNKMENYYRDLVRFEGKQAFLIAGNIFKGPVRTIGNGVHIPSHNFKIVVVLDRGQTLADINENTRVIAAIMPNSNSVSQQAKWSSFRTTVSAIEKQTGLSFFSHLPPNVAQALRDKVDRESIPDVDHPLWLQMQQSQAAAAAN